MSEEKVIQHAKKAVHAVGNKEKKWTEKIKEFLYEIIIIVLAVSITLWMHNWNDARHEHEIERAFLEGIKEDLNQEAEEANVKSNVNRIFSQWLIIIIRYGRQLKSKQA